MKKGKFSILFGLAVCLLLTSCNGLTASTTQSTLPPVSETTTGTPQSTATTSTEVQTDPIYENRYFFIYDEYLNYIATHEMHEKFVHYESLKNLGEFGDFYDYYNYDRYSFYYGGIYPVVPVQLNIYYDEGLPTDYASVDASEVVLNDMRLAKEVGYDVSGAYDQDGVMYIYEKNRLEEIIWERDGILYCLDMSYLVEYCFYEPIIDTSTIWGQLIHYAENAAAIVESIFAPVEE